MEIPVSIDKIGGFGDYFSTGGGILTKPSKGTSLRQTASIDANSKELNIILCHIHLRWNQFKLAMPRFTTIQDANCFVDRFVIISNCFRDSTVTAESAFSLGRRLNGFDFLTYKLI
jgi:hypothetical protein